jgi:hypothetical protein
VGFRFEDLKSVFKLEADRQKEETGTKSLPANFAVKIPEVMTLSVNYRCVWCGVLKAYTRPICLAAPIRCAMT